MKGIWFSREQYGLNIKILKLISKFSKFNELILYSCKGLCAVLWRLCLEPVCSASTVLFQFPDRFLVLVELVYLNIFRMAQAYRKYLIIAIFLNHFSMFIIS